MTIWVYEGTPGSGKTSHAVEEGLIAQKRPGGVVANFALKGPRKRADGSPRWEFWETSAMTVARLKDHAQRYHPVGKESQGLLIVDECHRLLNSRTTWASKSKADAEQLGLVTFLAEHRHWGYDVLLIIQNLRMLDRHARYLAEYRVKHFRWDSFWWLRWMPIPIFGRVTYPAQFPTMRGRLGLSLGWWSRGRYDFLAMREAGVRASAGSPAPDVSGGSGPTITQEGNDDAAASVEEVHEEPGTSPLMPELGGGGAALSGAPELQLPEGQRVDEDGNLVVRQLDGSEVLLAGLGRRVVLAQHR